MERIDTTARENKSLSLSTRTVNMVNRYPNHSYGMDDRALSYKVDDMLYTLCKLTNYSLPELADYFTAQEAAALCDIANGALNTIDIDPKSSLIANFNSSCSFESLDEKWEIDKKIMLEKLHGLTQFQAYIVQLLTSKFWDNSTGIFSIREIEELFMITPSVEDDNANE